MWVVRDFQIETQELDFTSAGLGKSSTRVLKSDSVSVINALKYFEFESNPSQALICEHCGTPQCGSGGWISLRGLGGHALFIPAFAEMRQGEWELTEYSPPLYMESRGALLFSDSIYSALRAEVPGFPECQSLPPLTVRDAIDLAQWEAPLKVLGSFPDPVEIRREDLLASSSGELDHAVRSLQSLLEARDTVLAPARPAETITFHLDGPSFPEWSPVAIDETGQVIFKLAPGVGAIPQASTAAV